MDKSPSGKKGICSNCGREKFIANKYGHCTVCSEAVKGIEKDTPDYTDALSEVKERLTNLKSPKSRKPAPRINPHIAKRPHKEKTALDLTIKEVAMVGMPGIIKRMYDERSLYLAEAEKLSKAINILESV